MFGSLKKKLNSAIQEGIIISESLQQQYRDRLSSNQTSSSVSSRLEESSISSGSSQFGSDLCVPNNVNLAAGCNLLSKYEDDWKAIHDANEENAERAEKAAAQIQAIHQRTNAQRVVLTDLISCLSGVPTLVKKLQESMKTLQEVTALSAATEDALEELQNLCEECELQEFMLQKQCELSQHKQQKMASLEQYRQKVAAEHQEKIRRHEDNLRQIQRERQAVFDDAFRGDLEEFKQKGALPKIIKETKELALEEVDLQEDPETKDALEEFLNG